MNVLALPVCNGGCCGLEVLGMPQSHDCISRLHRHGLRDMPPEDRVPDSHVVTHGGTQDASQAEEALQFSLRVGSVASNVFHFQSSLCWSTLRGCVKLFAFRFGQAVPGVTRHCHFPFEALQILSCLLEFHSRLNHPNVPLPDVGGSGWPPTNSYDQSGNN